MTYLKTNLLILPQTQRLPLVRWHLASGLPFAGNVDVKNSIVKLEFHSVVIINKLSLFTTGTVVVSLKGIYWTGWKRQNVPWSLTDEGVLSGELTNQEVTNGSHCWFGELLVCKVDKAKPELTGVVGDGVTSCAIVVWNPLTKEETTETIATSLCRNQTLLKQDAVTTFSRAYLENLGFASKSCTPCSFLRLCPQKTEYIVFKISANLKFFCMQLN